MTAEDGVISCNALITNADTVHIALPHVSFQPLRNLGSRTYYLYGTLQQPATRPLKTYSTAVWAIPLSVCHQGPPSGNRTGLKKVRTHSSLFS